MSHWKSVSNLLVTFKNGLYIFGAQIYNGNRRGNIKRHHTEL